MKRVRARRNSPFTLFCVVQYVQRYPTGAVMTLAYPSATISTVSFQYTSVGNGPLLMFALPHHMPIMVQPVPDNDENRVVQVRGS